MASSFFQTSGGPVATLEALKTSFAIIELRPDGTVITANDKFCDAMGFRLSEIVGKHHSLFVAPQYAHSAEYEQFWKNLRNGQFDSGEYKRFGKGGKEVWLQASYTPVLDGQGRVVKVVKLALEVTQAKTKSAEDASVLAAIFRSQAVVEFGLDGVVLFANDNFLKVVGYSASELVGQKHSLLCEPEYVASGGYQAFWEKLRRGEFLSSEFRRLGKGGREVWLQASYNPIFDADGKVTKVVTFATDLTERMADVARVSDALSRLAAGDLESRVGIPLMPSLDKLRVDFNAAAEALHEALRIVAENTGAIQAGAGQIAQASDDLSRRTEQQAASLEQTAAALDEITATVRRTAAGATEANASVGKTKAEAEQSGEVVAQAVEAMGQIEKSSRQISQIIGVIDEIAFQTNLLALNAGVEAARAGDAGRGFAVVAMEVRALAQRSAEAAKEIKALISASSQQVGQGVTLVGETGKALTSIVGMVGGIHTLIAQIAASAQEQSIGLAEVNSAVNQMDQIVQQNAAMVEESTAASHALRSEAEGLAGVVARFRVGGRSASGARPAPRLATAASRPARSPARAMAGKVAARYGGAAADNWEEF